MIYRTFLHLPGLDAARERRLWETGVGDWWDLLAARRVPGLSPAWLAALKRDLHRCLRRYDDLRYLAGRLPAREHWRLFEPFGSRAIYFDLETDGLRREEASVTVLGLYDGRRYRAFVAGEDLDEGLARLAEAEFVVTFAGSTFDYPFLRHHYPWLPEPVVHLDLAPLLRRVGLRGGLKRIERALGLVRPEEVEGLDGYGAVKLWRRWRQGDEEALALLVRYNREDVLNLAPLARFAYRALRKVALTGGSPGLTLPA